MRSRYISDDEVRRLREAVPPKKWLPVALALVTGLRVGDVVSLPRDALRGCELAYTASKTGKPGTATVPPELAAAIEAHANARWLFPSPYGGGEKHIRRETVWRRVKRAAERAGVDPDGCSPHSMRKVYAVRITAKHGIRAAQKALQHDRLSTTEDYALSDWATGENASLPLTRGDISMIVDKIMQVIGG